ncbi:MAG: GNAT family N-acetyltransferase [Aristaeellaceae bacterium]
MTLSLTPLTPEHPDLPRVMALMARSFPENERLPAAFLFDPGDGSRDFLAIREGDALCGFISLISWRDITHIMFFAVAEDRRNQGIGSRALRLLRERRPHARIIADVEAEAPAAPNQAQRLRRRQFYLRCGYAPTGIHYAWRGERWDIFSSGGDVTEAEFRAFWRHFDR